MSPPFCAPREVTKPSKCIGGVFSARRSHKGKVCTVCTEEKMSYKSSDNKVKVCMHHNLQKVKSLGNDDFLIRPSWDSPADDRPYCQPCAISTTFFFCICFLFICFSVPFSCNFFEASHWPTDHMIT